MAKKRTGLKMPYCVSDFRTIRNEGFSYVDKTECLAQDGSARKAELVGENTNEE